MKHVFRWDADKQEVVEVDTSAPEPDESKGPGICVPNYEFRAWSLPGMPRVKNRREIDEKVARSEGNWIWDR